jgi:hypothetical protein
MSSMLFGPTDGVETRPEPERCRDFRRDTGGAQLGELGPRLLGGVLVTQKLLTPEQLEWALAEQAKSGRLLGEIVVQNGLVSMVALVNALVEQLREGPER